MTGDVESFPEDPEAIAVLNRSLNFFFSLSFLSSFLSYLIKEIDADIW